MKHYLSILIPTYNGDCRRQVADLCRQADRISDLEYEIVVADDGSTDRLAADRCAEISRHPHCRFIPRPCNQGRAAIRNFLASQARYDRLLFMDCDMTIVRDDFLMRYLQLPDSGVVYGGYCVGDAPAGNLRFRYEKQAEPMHTATERSKRPYQHFHTCNFMTHRSVMLAHPFDERFRHYGYEDVLWGKQLRKAGIDITHIDNPAGFCTFEDNAHFVSKTEEGLRTLKTFQDDLRGYSHLLTFTDGIHLNICRKAIILWHRLFGKAERRWLCSDHPSMLVFSLYRLGYFITLK